jgi:MFS family permease
MQTSSWFNRNVLGFGLTSLLADLCYETATAVLPSFLALLQTPAYVLGLMEGTADALSSFVKMWSGWYSDRLDSRKPFVVAGYAITALAIGAMAWVTIWPLIVLLRIVAWIGKGARGPARNAMLTASVPAEHKGKAFGFHRAGDTVGAIVGPLIAAWLLATFASQSSLAAFQGVMAATLVPGLGAVLVLVLLIREVPISALPGEYRRWLVGVGIFGAGDFSHSLLILAATMLLVPSYGPIQAAAWAAALYGVRNIAAAVTAYPIGAASDRLGRLGLLAGAYFLSVIVTAGFAVAALVGVSEVWVLGLLFMGAGVVTAAQESLESVAASDLVPDPSLHGTAFGVLGTVNGLGDFVSSAIVGLLWGLSPVWGFAWAAGMMLIGAMVIVSGRGKVGVLR